MGPRTTLLKDWFKFQLSSGMKLSILNFLCDFQPSMTILSLLFSPCLSAQG